MILAILVIVLAAGLALESRRVGQLDQRLRRLTASESGSSLERILDAHLDKVLEVSREIDGLAARTDALESSGRLAFQRIGLVRFNPFEDTGSNQSFALAIMDAREDGIVISSLHARGSTRIYAKAIASGRAEAALSDEEAQAVGIARGASLGRGALVERVSQPDRGATSAG